MSYLTRPGQGSVGPANRESQSHIDRKYAGVSKFPEYAFIELGNHIARLVSLNVLADVIPGGGYGFPIGVLRKSNCFFNFFFKKIQRIISKC